jgi:hypothetical protein
MMISTLIALSLFVVPTAARSSDGPHWAELCKAYALSSPPRPSQLSQPVMPPVKVPAALAAGGLQKRSVKVAFAGTSLMGAADPAFMIGFLAGKAQLLSSQSQPETNNVNGAVFTQSGKELFVSAGFLSTSTLSRCDLSVWPPAWSTFYTPASGAAGPFDVQADEPRGLLYALESPTTSTGDYVLKAYDMVAGSPTYGMEVASTANLLTPGTFTIAESFALSSDGRIALVLEIFEARVIVVDTDPASATFMTVLHSLPIPSTSLPDAPFATDVDLSSSDGIALITLQHSGQSPSEVALLDLGSMTFTDFNGNSPGVQHMGSYSLPQFSMGSAAVTIDLANNATFAVVGGFGGSGWAGRIDFGGPSGWSYTAYSPSSGLKDVWSVSLSSDNQQVGIETQGEVLFLNPKTGVQVSAVGVPTLTNVYTLRLP